MWFKVVSLIIAVMLIAKAVIALVIPSKFYARRRQQYSSQRVPRVVMIASFLLVALSCATWYATVFHYTASGWIVTAMATAISGLSLGNTFQWSKHRLKMLRIIDRAEQHWQIDAGILGLGLCFLLLSVFVYRS